MNKEILTLIDIAYCKQAKWYIDYKMMHIHFSVRGLLLKIHEHQYLNIQEDVSAQMLGYFTKTRLINTTNRCVCVPGLG